jgi:2-(1,2-epoxy-1,2-dihydrophenyl)acetyl-CoA isomerase
MTAPAAARWMLAGDIATVTLARPDRHNALIPDLLEALNHALDEARRHAPRLLVLAAEGRSFSTGGDLAAFAAMPRGQRRPYADRLIGLLNDAILKLVDHPAPVLARIHGPVTGGSVGLMLGADIVVMAETAFVQPYYADVGFAPDGGWTVLMPERIGIARTAAILHANRRILPDEALRLGLADEITPPGDLDSTIARWSGHLLDKRAPSLAANRRLLNPPERRARIAAGLEAERAAFLDLIETDDAEQGMQRFLEGLTP